MTIKEALVKILTDDAKIPDAGHLGSLLEHTGTPPYGIYYMNPPDKPKFPLITYYEISASGHMPKVEAFNFTVWGGDPTMIHNIIFNLLDRKSLGVTENIALLWDWLGPVIFDQDFLIYVRVARYLQYGLWS